MLTSFLVYDCHRVLHDWCACAVAVYLVFWTVMYLLELVNRVSAIVCCISLCGSLPVVRDSLTASQCASAFINAFSC